MHTTVVSVAVEHEWVYELTRGLQRDGITEGIDVNIQAAVAPEIVESLK